LLSVTHKKVPGHQDIRVPQDAAWLAAFRYAEKSIFMWVQLSVCGHLLNQSVACASQTPTFNAKRAVRAALDACRRGIEVTLYLGLGGLDFANFLSLSLDLRLKRTTVLPGFNDKGESIPFQGGTNEQVVKRMYKALNSENKQDYLRVYWYVSPFSCILPHFLSFSLAFLFFSCFRHVSG
jgi:hypothetical protein